MKERSFFRILLASAVLSILLYLGRYLGYWVIILAGFLLIIAAHIALVEAEKYSKAKIKLTILWLLFLLLITLGSIALFYILRLIFG